MSLRPPTLRPTAASHVAGSLVLAFLLLPVLAVVPASFNASSFIRLPPQQVSLRWYHAFFADPEWLRALFASIEVALLATIIAVIVGTLAALGLERASPRVRALVVGLVLSPLIVPVIMTAIALYYVTRFIGLHGTVLGLALGHALLCLPFVVINVGIALRSVDINCRRAAEGLGASHWRIFRTITLPLILPGLVGGAAFAFVTSFDEVVIAIFLAGDTAKTLPVKMWEIVRVEFTPVAAVGSSLLIALTMLMFIAVQLLRQRGGEHG
jgi:putative spermidine/putrescine transport system permease protein